ncbi:MAG: class II fructose-bisphosphate aldolase [Gammaproteobacteria bacterium]|jgi:fructose-bisphosphate aldolase class II|nr:class II fructose-bisphosphate aldolase [Gammaproteobacteria bacterium]
MALVNMRDMLYHAYQNNYAVGAFDLVSLDFLEAVMDAAEKCRAPVILSIAEPHFAHYDYELMLPAVEAAAQRASVPVAIQLDHGHSLESATRAINLGCNSIMLDASNRNLPENIQLTRDVVEMAHGCGVPVIGELGYVAGVEGEGVEQHPGESALTVPAEAKVYVERTGVDGLAVSIGTVQGRMKGRAKLDFQRLKQLNQAVNIPLVIHGGSGLNEDQFRRLTSLGVAKINYFTALSDIAAKTMRTQIKQNPHGSFIELKAGVKEAIGHEVERCLRLWGSAGRAAEVLTQCEPWAPVEQLIMYNVERINDQQSHAAMEQGRQLLVTIPGVREVFAGEALKEDNKFRFCWRVRLCHRAAFDSYREHPHFTEFNNTLFRPVVGDKISVNYQDSRNTFLLPLAGSAKTAGATAALNTLKSPATSYTKLIGL